MSGGDDDLLQLTLQPLEPQELAETRDVRLGWSSDRFNVYENPDRTSEVGAGQTQATFRITSPKTLYVEAVAPSPGVRQDYLSFYFNGTLPVTADIVRLTADETALKSVSFGGAAEVFHTVQKDDGTGPYDAPHWQDNSRSLDGDALDEHPGWEDDRRYPVCYVRANPVTATVKMRVGPGERFSGDVLIKGDGPGEVDFPPTPATVGAAGDAWRAEATLQSEEPLENKVGHLAPMQVQWSLSRDGGATWFSPMPSRNEVFVTLAEPQCATLYRTVAYLACGNPGATDEGTALDNTWQMFSTGGGPANVCAWNESDRDYTRPLHYYLTETGQRNTRTPELLRDADGQCHAWADLMKEALWANGITGVLKTRIVPASGFSRFAVRNIGFGDPSYPEDDPWMYAEDDLDTSVVGVPGQNMATPQAKLFSRHFINDGYLVKLQGKPTYYDPSYGITANNAHQYTVQAIDAWERQMADGSYRWKSATGASDLRFFPESW